MKTVFIITKKQLVAGLLVMLSLLLAAYAPLSVTNAQSAAEAMGFEQLKEKALQEIERRLDNYKKTRESLNVDVKISKEESSIKVISNKGDASAVINEDGFDSRLQLSREVKDKVKQFMEKVVEQLTGLKQEVNEATSMEDLKDLVKKVDEQYQLTQLVDVQASVTNAVESLTGVVDKIETTFANLKSQVTKMRECARGINNTESTINASAPGCDDFNWSSAEAIVKAESGLANVATMGSTVKSILSSAMALLATLVSSFTSLLSGLGDSDGLSNLGNLSNLGDLTSQLGGAGAVSGLLGSFGAITSQTGIANGMSGNALGGLGELGDLINVGGLDSQLSNPGSELGIF